MGRPDYGAIPYMTVVSLTEGVIRILRDNVSGWAVSEDDVEQVAPSHPPDELGPSMYPRSAVDVASNSSDAVNVTVDKFIEDMTVEVTVYSTDSLEMNRLLDDSREAIKTYHDEEDADGNAYLPMSYLQAPGVVGPTFETGEVLNVTRYNRSFEFEFKTLSQND